MYVCEVLSSSYWNIVCVSTSHYFASYPVSFIACTCTVCDYLPLVFNNDQWSNFVYKNYWWYTGNAWPYKMTKCGFIPKLRSRVANIIHMYMVDEIIYMPRCIMHVSIVTWIKRLSWGYSNQSRCILLFFLQLLLLSASWTPPEYPPSMADVSPTHCTHSTACISEGQAGYTQLANVHKSEWRFAWTWLFSPHVVAIAS